MFSWFIFSMLAFNALLIIGVTLYYSIPFVPLITVSILALDSIFTTFSISSVECESSNIVNKSFIVSPFNVIASKYIISR